MRGWFKLIETIRQTDPPLTSIESPSPPALTMETNGHRSIALESLPSQSPTDFPSPLALSTPSPPPAPIEPTPTRAGQFTEYLFRRSPEDHCDRCSSFLFLFQPRSVRRLVQSVSLFVNRPDPKNWILPRTIPYFPIGHTANAYLTIIHRMVRSFLSQRICTTCLVTLTTRMILVTIDFSTISTWIPYRCIWMRLYTLRRDLRSRSRNSTSSRLDTISWARSSSWITSRPYRDISTPMKISLQMSTKKANQARHPALLFPFKQIGRSIVEVHRSLDTLERISFMIYNWIRNGDCSRPPTRTIERRKVHNRSMSNASKTSYCELTILTCTPPSHLETRSVPKPNC